MNLNFLCCIGAEQKHDQSGLLKMNQIYFYRAYADETMSEILEDNFFNHSESHLKENDIILAYSPNEQDLPKVRWLRIVIPHAGLVKTEKVDNSYLLEVLRNDLRDLGDQVAEIEAKIPGSASVINQLATQNDITNKITNCITEIPQDIKLELNNGTLTLKAGSKVYVPNGFGSDGTTPKFDEVNIASDTNITSTGGTAQCFICIDITGRLSATSAVAASVSGAGVEHINYGLCYDTSTNIIQRWGDNTIAIDKASFPLAIVKVSNGVFTSIDHVFNGFGYIGGTIFTLPGVKGLVPNGRNADGTLKNANVFSATTVKTNTPIDGERDICLSRYSGYTDVPYVGTYIYDAEDNFVKRSSDGQVGGYVFAGKFTKTGGRITDFYVRPAFHAVDYSDTEYMAHQAMPSGSYVELTLPASGGTITAPADGYVTLTKTAGASGEYAYMRNTANGINSGIMATGALNCRIFIPVSKGHTVSINYTLSGSTSDFRFVYANGAK